AAAASVNHNLFDVIQFGDYRAITGDDDFGVRRQAGNVLHGGRPGVAEDAKRFAFVCCPPDFDRVGTRSPVHQVAAATSIPDQGVVALAPLQGVVAATAKEHVVAAQADQQIVTVQAQQDVITGGARQCAVAARGIREYM